MPPQRAPDQAVRRNEGNQCGPDTQDVEHANSFTSLAGDVDVPE
jgi:hypothetical protein